MGCPVRSLRRQSRARRIRSWQIPHESAAERDVQQLDASADSQDRPAVGIRPAEVPWPSMNTFPVSRIRAGGGPLAIAKRLVA